MAARTPRKKQRWEAGPKLRFLRKVIQLAYSKRFHRTVERPKSVLFIKHGTKQFLNTKLFADAVLDVVKAVMRGSDAALVTHNVTSADIVATCKLVPCMRSACLVCVCLVYV